MRTRRFDETLRYLHGIRQRETSPANKKLKINRITKIYGKLLSRYPSDPQRFLSYYDINGIKYKEILNKSFSQGLAPLNPSTDYTERKYTVQKAFI